MTKQTITNKIKELTFVEPRLFLDEKTIIVGSSNSLLSAEHGKYIDDFNDVIRFNRAPIDRLYNHIGEKCTLRVVNNHVFDNIDAEKDGYTKQPQYFIKNLANQRILYIAEDLSPWNRREQNTHKDSKLFKFDYNNIDKLFDNGDNMRLCIGTIITMLCVEANIKPVIIGFDVDTDERSHYWENRPGAGDCHKVVYDNEILINLEKENKIVIIR